MSKGYSQQEGYKPIRSVGPLPDDFIQTSYPIQATENSSAPTSISSKEQDKLSTSEFLLHQLLTSGNVLFGDSVSQYLNRIADQLLADQKDLRANIRVYALKSTLGTIVSTPSGIILVPLQLIAQAENEAQIAYLLAVEIARIENNEYNFASSEKFQNPQAIENKTQMLRSPDMGTNPFPYINEAYCYSFVYRLYRNAGYESAEAVNSLDVVRLSHLPFLDESFHPSFFEFDSLRFPTGFFLENPQSTPFTTNSLEDESHNQRQQMLEEIITLDQDKKGQVYKLSKAEFQSIKKIARFETILVELTELKYVRAFYDSYCLLSLYPQNTFLEEATCKAIYGISKYVNADKELLTGLNSLNGYGNYERCQYFFAKLTKDQLNLVAIRYLFSETEKNKDPFIIRLLEDLIGDGIDKNYLDFDVLSAKIKSTIDQKTRLPVETLASTVTEEKPEFDNSKFDRLRKEKEEMLRDTTNTTDADVFNAITNLNFETRAFENVDLARLKIHFDKGAAALKKKKQRRFLNDESVIRKHSKTNSYGVDSLIFVNPSLYEFNKKQYLNPEVSAEKTKILQQNLSVCTAAAQIESISTTNYYSRENSEDEFNLGCALNTLLAEMLTHTVNDVDLISLESHYALDEIKSTGMRHACFITATHKKNWRKPNAYSAIVGSIPISIVVPFLSPAIPVLALTKAHDTRLNILVFDLNNSELMWSQETWIKYKDSAGMMNSFIYDSLLSLKSTEDQAQ